MDVRALVFAAMLAGLVVAFSLGGLALRSRVLAGRQAAAPADPEPRMVSHSQRRRRKAAREAKAARELLAQTTAPPVRRPSHRRRTRATFASTSALVMMLILALGSIGVVQGMWSKNLTITGTVETGDLNADFDKIETLDRCGQTNTAEISHESYGVTRQTNTYSYGGDSDGGSDNPCPPDPCPDGTSYSLSGGGGDPCPPDPCPDGTTYSLSGGSGGDPCPPDPCPDGGTYSLSGGGGDPCPDGTSYSLSGGGGDPDPCPDGKTYSLSGGGGDPCPPDPCPDGNTYSLSGGSGGYSPGGDGGDDDGGNACPPNCDVTIGGVGGDSEFGNQVAYVDIANATPGYWCKIKAFVGNTGSLPFNIIGINGILDTANDEGLSFYDLNGSQPGVCKLIDESGNDRADWQVDPGEEGIVYCKILVDESTKTCTKWYDGTCKEWGNTGGAEYGWTYHFAVEVCVAQWNEDPSTGGESADFDACKHPSSGTHEGPDTPVLPAPGPTT